jgi:hypothetical protein
VPGEARTSLSGRLLFCAAILMIAIPMLPVGGLTMAAAGFYMLATGRDPMPVIENPVFMWMMDLPEKALYWRAPYQK